MCARGTAERSEAKERTGEGLFSRFVFTSKNPWRKRGEKAKPRFPSWIFDTVRGVSRMYPLKLNMYVGTTFIVFIYVYSIQSVPDYA